MQNASLSHRNSSCRSSATGTKGCITRPSFVKVAKPKRSSDRSLGIREVNASFAKASREFSVARSRSLSTDQSLIASVEWLPNKNWGTGGLNLHCDMTTQWPHIVLHAAVCCSDRKERKKKPSVVQSGIA